MKKYEWFFEKENAAGNDNDVVVFSQLEEWGKIFLEMGYELALVVRVFR